MIYYYVSNVYHNTVLEAIQNTNEVIANNLVSDEIFINEEIKYAISSFKSVNIIIIDLNSLKDEDEEIIEAIEMIRTMYDNIRIIILAANRKEGDILLTKCFAMGIYDIITSKDYIEIKNEIIYCLETGKKYGDSLKYKDVIENDKISIKSEIRQVVNKITVGIIGSQNRIGNTHLMIILANYLRSKGFRVAMIEKSDTHAFEYIRDSYECKFENNHFKLDNNDYFPSNSKDDGIILTVMQSAYNFIITDYGIYKNANMDEFNKQDIKIVICGSKPWEIANINGLFESQSKEQLIEYNYIFNYINEKKSGEYLRENMGELKKVYFASFEADPFTSHEFPGADEIFKKYIVEPEKENVKKKKFSFKRGKE